MFTVTGAAGKCLFQLERCRQGDASVIRRRNVCAKSVSRCLRSHVFKETT